MTNALAIDQGEEWLSPTRAWRLTECPASAGAGVKGTAVATMPEVNTGTLAHRVVERWIVGEGYRAENPRHTLSAAIDESVAELSGDLPIGWALARARLLVRGTELAALLGERSPDEVIPERELKDPELRLRGTPDLVLLGDEVTLIDLKTQTFIEEDVPDWVRFQLTIYTHLVELAYGSRPDRVEVFSLNRGQIPVEITDDGLNEALRAVYSVRELDRHDAKPEESVCYFCRRRLGCQAHWDAANTWPNSDGVQGTIRRIEQAATGVVAVLVETIDKEEVWVAGVPSSIMTGSPGNQVRFIRLGRTRTNASGLIGQRWARYSALLIAHPA